MSRVQEGACAEVFRRVREEADARLLRVLAERADQLLSRGEVVDHDRGARPDAEQRQSPMGGGTRTRKCLRAGLLALVGDHDEPVAPHHHRPCEGHDLLAADVARRHVVEQDGPAAAQRDVEDAAGHDAGRPGRLRRPRRPRRSRSGRDGRAPARRSVARSSTAAAPGACTARRRRAGRRRRRGEPRATPRRSWALNASVAALDVSASAASRSTVVTARATGRVSALSPLTSGSNAPNATSATTATAKGHAREHRSGRVLRDAGVMTRLYGRPGHTARRGLDAARPAVSLPPST